MRLDPGAALLSGAIAIGERLANDEIPLIEPLMRRLWPICRSLTGPGVRETLDIIGEHVPLKRRRFASGSDIYDWTVPPEWRIRDAYILNEAGERIVDFRVNNLHVIGYSEPADVVLDLDGLQQHLESLPELPDAIPYVTSYFDRRWGFCMTHRQRKTLRQGTYRCVIDADLDPDGYLDVADTVLPGASATSVFFSTYCCHPSMANNELSGPAVQTALFEVLGATAGLRMSYRGAFTTETLGTLCYLSEVGEELRRTVVGGAVMTCVGDDGPFTYVRPRRRGSEAARVIEHALRHAADGRTVQVADYSPVGSDERQYCSPGFDLPIGSISRGRFDYPGYHTSLDNFDGVSEVGLKRSLRALLLVCQAFEMNLFPVRTNPYGEPQLGRRGLYRSHRLGMELRSERLLDILTWADGTNNMIDIAEVSGCPVWLLLDGLKVLCDQDLVRLAPNRSPTWPAPL